MKCGRDGFTLIETMMAIGVLAVIVLLLTGLITTHFAMQSKSDETNTAIHVAETEMNRWKSRPYSEIAALLGGPGVSTSRNSDGREYVTVVSVLPLTPNSINPGGRVLRVQVEVQWAEQTALGPDGTRAEREAKLAVESVVSPGASL